MKVAVRSDVGRNREINEDRAWVDSNVGLAILADGMGGHLAGEIASSLAVKIIAAHLTNGLHGGDGDIGAESIGSLLNQSIGEANRIIRARAMEDPNLKGMGTTVVLALSRGDAVHISHVGDSRAYLFRGGFLQQLTRDHSLVAEMVAAGEISEMEARSHRLRYVLSRSVGHQSAVQADAQVVRWAEGDCLMLCSDGLTNMVEDRKIGKILGRHATDLEGACKELVRVANAKGGKDNITVILACPE